MADANYMGSAGRNLHNAYNVNRFRGDLLDQAGEALLVALEPPDFLATLCDLPRDALQDGGARLTLLLEPGGDRVVSGVRIESITDLEGGGKDDLAPSPNNEFDFGSTWDPATRTFTANIGILPGDGTSVQVAYTYTWEPSESVLAAWEALRQAAVATLTEQALTEQFERNKALITEKSRTKSRPANDLRREERCKGAHAAVSIDDDTRFDRKPEVEGERHQ